MTTFNILTSDSNTFGSVRHIINYSAVDPALIIKQVEDTLFKSLRTHEMKKLRSLNLLEDQFSIALLEEWEFLDPIYLKSRNYFNEISAVRDDELLSIRDYDPETGLLQKAPPVNYAIFDGALQFNNRADEDYQLEFLYYTTEGNRLSETNQESFLTKKHYDLLFTGIKAIGASYRQDMHNVEMQLMQQLMGKITAVNAESDMNDRAVVTDGNFEALGVYG